MQANMIRQSLKELPLQQRAVAIALKNIYDKIKETNKKEQEQIDANHMSFISRFKVLEKKASEIIRGKVITEQQLDTFDSFFTAAELPQKQKLMKEQTKLEHYWYKCFQNSNYKQELSDQDCQILKFVSDIQTNVTTNQMIVIITIDKNEFISQGTFSRSLTLENGIPVKFEGQEPKWTVQKQDGVLGSFLFVNTSDDADLPVVMDIMSNLINEIVPYSLEYYLGAVARDEFDGEEIEEQEDAEQEDKE